MIRLQGVADAKQRVVILGGGVAGLSAAHELAQRGFAVQVFEQREVPGGKARSTRVPKSAAAGKSELPGEHGFRFFPGFYWHLPDTMRRIPSHDGQSVEAHLHAVETMTFAFDAAPPYSLPAHQPKTWREFSQVLRYVAALGEMGITSDDLVFIWWQLWKIITSCSERRVAELERQSWWDYVDAGHRSQAFRHLLVVGVTRNLVASKAEKANARTVGQVGIQLLLDLVTGRNVTDRILDGPTNDVWIDPWVAHLREKYAVDYQLGWELEHVELDGAAREVKRVVVRRAQATRPRLQVETVKPLVPRPAQLECEERHARWREKAQKRRLLNVRLAEEVRSEPPSEEKLVLEADHFVFALPVEVMADVLEQQPELLRADPQLSGILELGRHQVEWMNGIQFYLTADVPIARGHVNHVDSPWALTSISQSQFWPDYPSSGYADGRVRTIFSVDISAWDIPSPSGKEARDCDYQEVAEETWRQLKISVNRERVVLTDAMLHPTTPWHIDDDIVERVRKERRLARSDVAHRADRKRKEGRPDEPDLLTNAEPLLVNLVDSWGLRPQAVTAISKLYLASDYLQTNTNLATMEAANEAARAATNAILQASGSSAEPCVIRPLAEPFAALRALDAERLQRKEPAKNPLWADALAFLALFFGVTGLKALAWLNAVPRVLWLLSALMAGLLYGFGRVWNDAWLFAFHQACGLAAHTAHVPAACLVALPPVPSSGGRAEFWYAAYLAIFGVSLFFMPKKTLGQLGFPGEYGPWIPILAATPLIMSTFYATSAVFDVRLFFWFSIVGRVTVFLSVLYLTEGRHQGSPLLVMVAAPDAASAVWSGMALAPNEAMARFFCLGVLNLVGAFAFSFFPGAALAALGFPSKASAWVPMAAILLWFWGLYSALAVAFGLEPLLLAGFVSEALFAALCGLAPLIYGLRADLPSAAREPAGAKREGSLLAPGFRLSLVGLAYGGLAWWLWAALRA